MTVPSGSDPISQTHRFICTGCHIHFTSLRTCPVCGSPVVPIAELTRVRSRAMQPPAPRPHELSAVLTVVASVLATGLAWGEVTMWGVVPCVAIAIVLLVAPISRWERSEPGDQLGALVRQAGSDGHVLQDGAARATAAVTSTRRPVGCAGLLFGVVLPLATVQWDHAGTIAAAVLAITAFLLAWIRRVRREGEASAGRGVPL